MKMFNSWTYNMIKHLFLYTDQRRYYRNQKVFDEGDEPEALYMIKSGDFQVKIRFVLILFMLSSVGFQKN